ncbi:hypothetical protein CCASP_07805 [Corynebacterium caspium DSM 44850]|nr:hypothetical protein CCASP_07805 [Corynebacterium caspium DSM 44850]
MNFIERIVVTINEFLGGFLHAGSSLSSQISLGLGLL